MDIHVLAPDGFASAQPSTCRLSALRCEPLEIMSHTAHEGVQQGLGEPGAFGHGESREHIQRGSARPGRQAARST